MTTFRRLTLTLGLALPLALVALSPAAGAEPKEIKGAAILEHPAAKVAMKNMSLMHAGKVEEAVKLGTKATQDQWNAMPAEDRKLMSEMMTAFAIADDEFRADVEKFGVLVIDGDRATLTIKKEVKDDSGSGTQTTTLRLQMEDGEWRVARK